MQYTDEQRLILGHDITRHACILAGPGTGKSTTIIALVSQLKEGHPERVIRLLTFTRAANIELASKVEQEGMQAVESSTVHSFAISVLLRNPGVSRLPEPLRIARDWEWRELIRPDLARRLGVRQSEVTRLKNEMSAEWESLAPEDDPAVSPELRGRFKGVWDEHRQVFGYSLLAELPFRLKGALEGNPNLDIGNLNIIAVYEYQDLNACDIACVRLLRDRGVIVVAIGDDDQSIYRFRKAHPEGIRSFPQDYNAVSYPLTISHRLGQSILAWANYVIAQDTGRAGKVPVRPSDGNPPGVCAHLVFADQLSEGAGVAGLIQWLGSQEPPVPREEILVLARTDELCDSIKEGLHDAGIDYADPKEGITYLNAEANRELILTLQIAVNPSDSVAWWGILTSTPRIGTAAMNSLYDLAKMNRKQLGVLLLEERANGFATIDPRIRDAVATRVTEMLERIDRLEIPEEGIWGQWIRERLDAGELPPADPTLFRCLESIDEEYAQLQLHLTLPKYLNRLEPTLKDIGSHKVNGKVRIMNMGASKGLTVQATIVVGAEDNIIPHELADEQEERRLLYVAMTRSTRYLFLTHARRRTGPTARISRPDVRGNRVQCRFLEGGPIRQVDGKQFLDLD